MDKFQSCSLKDMPITGIIGMSNYFRCISNINSSVDLFSFPDPKTNAS